MRFSGYLAVFRLGLQLTFVARAWFLVRLAGVTASTLVPYYVWRAVFLERQQIDQFDWPQIQTYLVIGAIFGVIMSDDGGLAERIAEGDIIADLTRPWGLLMWRVSDALGRCAFDFLIAVALWLTVIHLLPDVARPSTPGGWSLLLGSAILAILIKMGTIQIVAICACYVYETYGLERLRLALTTLLSGAIMPVELFPDWLRTVAHWLPFQSIVSTPAEVAIGRNDTAGTVLALLQQVLWCVLLLAGVWVMWWKGRRHIAIQGG
jgi:ABC-2 type transport system permease protein